VLPVRVRSNPIPPTGSRRILPVTRLASTCNGVKRAVLANTGRSMAVPVESGGRGIQRKRESCGVFPANSATHAPVAADTAPGPVELLHADAAASASNIAALPLTEPPHPAT